MGVLKPSGNGLYLLSNTKRPQGTPHVNTLAVLYISLALTVHYDYILWHRRCGHLNMHSL
jgi:hypothetical protein